MSEGNRSGPSDPLHRAVFGPFELDVRAGELRKHGVKIRLEEQPFSVREREAQLAEAEENVRRLKEEVAVAIERSYNKLERTKNQVQVADQIVKLRQESERVAKNEVTQGAVLVSERRQATAAIYKAQADLLQASLGYLLAWAELEQTVGRTPGF